MYIKEIRIRWKKPLEESGILLFYKGKFVFCNSDNYGHRSWEDYEEVIPELEVKIYVNNVVFTNSGGPYPRTRSEPFWTGWLEMNSKGNAVYTLESGVRISFQIKETKALVVEKGKDPRSHGQYVGFMTVSGDRTALAIRVYDPRNVIPENGEGKKILVRGEKFQLVWLNSEDQMRNGLMGETFKLERDIHENQIVPFARRIARQFSGGAFFGTLVFCRGSHAPTDHYVSDKGDWYGAKEEEFYRVDLADSLNY